MVVLPREGRDEERGECERYEAVVERLLSFLAAPPPRRRRRDRDDEQSRRRRSGARETRSRREVGLPVVPSPSSA